MISLQLAQLSSSVVAAACLLSFMPSAYGGLFGITSLDAWQPLQGNRSLTLANDYFKKGQYEQALAQLEQVVKQHPELPPARFLLAKLFLAANQTPQARRLLEQVAAESSEEPDLHLAFGHLALQEQRLSDAALQYEKAATLSAKKQWPTDRRTLCGVLCQGGLASVAESRGDWSTASKCLVAALNLDAKQAHLRQRLGRAQFHLQQYQEAQRELERAAQEDPSLEPAALSLARLYVLKGDQPKAEEWLRDATKNHSQDYRSHYSYAVWLLEQDRLAEAQQHVSRAAALKDSERSVRFTRGLIARLLGQYDEAEQEFTALHNEQPTDLESADQLALCLVEQTADPAKRQRALQLAISNLRQKPESRELHATLGWCLNRCGKLGEAELTLRKSIEGGLGPPAAGYYLARTLADQGKESQVLPLLQGAAQAKGQFPYRKQVESWLATLGKAEPAAK